MKRYVVGTLLFSIVMFVQLFGDIPVFADTFVPTSSYDFTGLADLGYALVGGAEFDFEGSPYVIDNYNSLTAEQKEIEKSLAARQFLKDYMESRDIAFEENGELQPGAAYYTIAFGLAGQEFFEAFQTASAAEQENMTYNMPISPSRFADWAQYNRYWINRYSDSFASDSDQESANIPDPNYYFLNDLNTFYVNTIYPNSYADLFSFTSIYDAYTSALYYAGDLRVFSFTGDFNNAYNIHTARNIHNQSNILTCLLSPVITINVTASEGNSVLVTYSSFNTVSFNNKPQNGFYVYNNTLYTELFNNTFNYTQAIFNSLSDALNYIYDHYCNINLYVNGDPWVLVGDQAPANPVIPDFPDIINQENGELAYDIAMPKTQDYSGSFDLTALFDAIREGIAGASDGDLATGSTIGSLDVGRTYTGEGIDINDRVIDLTSSRVFDGTLTDDTTGRLPKPPVVPPAVSAGLGGVTVLAKYVDATQCILPEELVTAFWGCVWILIMLGLIKNLHR